VPGHDAFGRNLGSLNVNYEEGTEKSFGGCGRVVTAALFLPLELASYFIVSSKRKTPDPYFL
jgi:hypothetical protein